MFPAAQKQQTANFALRDISAHLRLRTLVLLFLTLAIFNFACTRAQAQNPDDSVHITPRTKADAPPPPPAAPTGGAFNPAMKVFTKPIKVNVDLVELSVTVTDPMNRVVTGLDKDNFKIFEGSKPETIQNFSSEDAPISLGVIFDMSGSMSDKIDKARDAAVEFFKTANPDDEFFMIAFSDRPEVISDFTKNIDQIQGKLLYTVAKGQTALLDAIYLGLDKMKAAKNARKALLILSDGGDNHSRYTEHEIKDLVKEADVQIYAIGLFDFQGRTPEEAAGPALLDEITEQTGGRTYVISDPNELADTATKISMELRNQYVLGYRPSNSARDGKWHKVKVKLEPPKGLPPLHVYAKNGYYAPAQ